MGESNSDRVREGLQEAPTVLEQERESAAYITKLKIRFHVFLLVYKLGLGYGLLVARRASLRSSSVRIH